MELLSKGGKDSPPSETRSIVLELIKAALRAHRSKNVLETFPDSVRKMCIKMDGSEKYSCYQF